MLNYLQAQVSMPTTDYTQWGIAGAVVFVVGLFLWFLTKEREDRKAERESFVRTIDRNNESQNNLAGAVNNLALKIESCPDNQKTKASK